MFGRWRKNGRDDPRAVEGTGDEVVAVDLREHAFGLDPAQLGVGPTEALPRVFGAMVDLGQEGGCATVAAFPDGTTSLYTSVGGGILGGGVHPAVREASIRFLVAVEASLDLLPPSEDRALAGPGRVVVRALTYEGPHAAEASADELAGGAHALSPVFVAAHGVITQLRLVQESGTR